MNFSLDQARESEGQNELAYTHEILFSFYTHVICCFIVWCENASQLFHPRAPSIPRRSVIHFIRFVDIQLHALILPFLSYVLQFQVASRSRKLSRVMSSVQVHRDGIVYTFVRVEWHDFFF